MPACETSAIALGAHGIANRDGVDWLLRETEQGNAFPPSPHGFYFAKLWYFERLYPQVWCVEALGRQSDLL